MHNKEIDHLYSLSLNGGQQNPGQFAIDSIRMKSNIGMAGEVSRIYSNLIGIHFPTSGR
jgi:hypothetical protein